MLQTEFGKKCLSTQDFRIFLCWTGKWQRPLQIKIWYISARSFIIFKLAFYNREKKRNDIPFILVDAIQSDKGIYLRLITWFAVVGTVLENSSPEAFFGMLLCLGKSIVKNQTVDFPHLSLLSFGPNVKNTMQQVGMFQTSRFSSSFFLFSFIHTRSPWSLIDQFENSIVILKAKAKHTQYMAKIKQIALKIAGGSAQCW